MMKRIILILLLLSTLLIHGQRKYAAEKYFNDYSYKKSAELYQRLYDKGDKSYLVLSRLADSYYYTFSYEKSEEAYKELTALYKESVSPKHIFRYSQVLKSNGKVKDSDGWLLKLKELNGDDSRAQQLVSNKGYFITYTNKPKTYVHIHNVSINTEYSDFGGFLYDEDFYFWSSRPSGNNSELYGWNNQPYLNIYKAKQATFGDQEVIDLSEVSQVPSINSKYHDSNIILTKDGETMYFTRANYRRKGKNIVDKKGRAHLKLLKAKKIQNGWGLIEELPFNNKAYSVGHPALSEDERTLFFVSDRPGGYGETDLYKVRILEDGSFGEPENLGDTINTEGREMFPFVRKDKLFFASDGHIGLGALDVFESKIEEEGYTIPINLGEPINGPMDDFGLVMNKEGTAGYFSSNRKGGKGDDDVYSFKIYKCNGDISGIVSDSKTGKPLNGVLIALLDEEGEPVLKQKTKEDGSYSFTQVNCDKKFVLTTFKNDYKSAKKNLITKGINQKKLESNLTIDPLIFEGKIVINPIYFDYGSHKVRDDAANELETVVSVMKNYPDMIIKIESHTDSRGTYNFNKRLSDRRAKATRDYILSRGIEKHRIESAIGYGESKPLNDCYKKKCTEEQHQQNRRSYFIIVKK